MTHQPEKRHSEISERRFPHLGVFFSHLALTNHNVGTRIYDDNLKSRNNYLYNAASAYYY